MEERRKVEAKVNCLFEFPNDLLIFFYNKSVKISIVKVLKAKASIFFSDWFNEK